MKKISILSLHLGFGGIEKSIVALANLLCDKYKVEIVSVYKLYDNPVFNIDERVKITYLLDDIKPNHEQIRIAKKKKNPFKLFKEGIYGFKVLYHRRKSMVKYIVNCDSDYIISTRDIFNDWLSVYGKPDCIKIGWEHNHYHGNLRYADNVVRSCKKLDYLVLVSYDLELFYSNRLSKSKCKCVYIPNILDDMPKNLAKLESNRLVSVGRLSPEKGFMDLLKMFNNLHKENPDIYLDIIGDGKEKDNLEKFIKKNKLGSNVTLHGFQNKKYIDKVLEESSLYVMTSYTESFGIVLLEAMSHGVPCIAFDSAEGAKELITSGDNGYLIHNRSFEAMIKKIEDLMNDYERRREMGKSAREFSKQFTGDVVVDKWINLLETGDIDE